MNSRPYAPSQAVRQLAAPPSPDRRIDRTQTVLLESGAMNSEHFGLSYQIGQRLCSHFLHDMPPMNLHGNLGKSKFGCYLFIHETGRYRSQNLPLAGGQGLKQRLQVRDCLVRLAPLSIPLDRRHYGIEHVLITKRLGQEIDRSSLHSPDGHRNVAVARHEDNWNVNFRFG